MRNTPPLETELLELTKRALIERLPRDWRVEVVPAERMGFDTGVDAVLRVAEPAGAAAAIDIEVKSRLSPKDAQRAQFDRWGRGVADTKKMLVVPYLSPRAREELELNDFAYLDATGNVYLALVRPAVFIRTVGASANPWPEERPLRSLRGGVSARVVRALLDFDPPFGVSEIAELAKVPVPTASRVVTLLDREAVLSKQGRGRSVFIEDVAKPKLLRRWAEDYSVRRRTALAPRGLPALLDDLRMATGRYAVTGSLAAAQLAPYAPSRLGVLFVEGDVERGLDLVMRADSPNVFLLTPYDSAVFERTWERDDITYAAPSQVAVDLLTGPGRGPAEAEELIEWLENRGSWKS